MSDRVYIVTGAAKGIGFACAQRLVADGHRVVLADMDTEAGDKSAADLAAGNDKAIFVECDVSDPLHVHNLIAETLGSFGRIDGLINNAGIALKGGSLDLSIEDFDRVLAVNLRGAFLVSQAVAKYMVKEIDDREDRSRLTDRPYAIVNMSSINEQVAIPDYIAYTMSKGGMRQMTRAMAIELAPYGIRVNAIGPGSIKTDMLASVNSDKKAQKKLLSRTPLGRPGHPDEVASVAAFLLSEESSYITGQTIYPDGGRLALNYTMPVAEDEDDA
ncbi:SDR family NAD(P)-dependent oxidoreductase [Litorimonas sp. RW-G-Af-16]|uniref:SDR family NAD(P)-dependent oxidoreductase n=1 Tax=Litorimonas sp. RW-G-Af-16 TaxID=3241168 RepID=UPI00390C4831